MTFPEHLRAHRARLGINQTEMAQLLDVSPRTYWTWESGESVPAMVTQEGCLARLKKAKIPVDKRAEGV